MHQPVLLHEAIKYLNLAPGKSVIDATLDGGGHTLAILEQYPDVRVLGIEWDNELMKEFNVKCQRSNVKGVIAVHDSYTNIGRIVKEYDFVPDAVLFDLGLSSWHYETSGRGFSFLRDEPLDMRFNPEGGKPTAADIVNGSDEKMLGEYLSQFGEEQFAESIAKEIVRARRGGLIERTTQLVAVIGRAVPGWYKRRKIHFATKTFQALRMAVNGEVENVRRGVSAALDAVKPGGRVVVISFHGVEDKTVRSVFKDYVARGIARWVTKTTIKPKWEEVRRNPRARSAKMKIAERLY